MRLIVLQVLMIFQVYLTAAQTSTEKIYPGSGKYKVGYKHYTTSDSSRSYTKIFEYTNKKSARPMPVSIWYPSEQNEAVSKPMTVLGYLEILKKEEEWEHLPNEQILSWFYYQNTSANQKHLTEKTNAYANAEYGTGQFPVIVYAPSYQASSVENFALCEYLASHGFVVISSPSRGTESRRFSDNNPKEMETQAADVEFLMKESGKVPVADYGKIAIMGFSFGGLSNIIVQNRNDFVQAIVSLDGTERYQYGLLKQSPFFDAQYIDVPYMHMAQKDIPAKVLKEDLIDAELNTKFQLYDSVTKSKTYSLKFHHLTHTYFSTLGILFAERDKRQDKNDSEIMESYKLAAIYTLNFLNAVLNKDKDASEFLENHPSENGIADNLLTLKIKQPEEETFTFRDFNELALSQNYENLFRLYKSILKDHPSFTIPEGNLNVLGLQLVFNSSKSAQGINILLFGTKLYPNSSNLYDSLAEGYLFIGNKKMAVRSFEKSLELNSQNQNAVKRLEQLKE